MVSEHNIKQNVFKQCKAVLEQRLKTLQQTISDIQNALLSETKSTAGDKHETGRAMLQLEREKTGQQLAELQKQFELLHKIYPDKTQHIAALGSIVFTTKHNYFLAVSVGELQHNADTFYGISPATPIGQLLISKAVGDTFQFRGETITITKIL